MVNDYRPNTTWILLYSMKPYNTNHSKFPKKKLKSYCLVSNFLKENCQKSTQIEWRHNKVNRAKIFENNEWLLKNGGKLVSNGTAAWLHKFLKWTVWNNLTLVETQAAKKMKVIALKTSESLFSIFSCLFNAFI